MPGGRPPLRIGTYGDIAVSQQPDGRYKARARFRDSTGQVRYVSRFADTKGRARDALREALAQWQDDQSQGLTRSTTLTALARDWYAEVESDPRKATGTLDAYLLAIENYVIPYVGAVRIGEADTGVLDSALRRISSDKGPSSARTTRSVLTGMFNLAARHGAAPFGNPVRETRPITNEADPARALSVVETADLMARLRDDPQAGAEGDDVVDMFDGGLATGCRIGEVLATRDCILDVEAGTVEINGTVIRVKGRGLAIQERTKTEAGWRVLALPDYYRALIADRRARLQFNPSTVLHIDRRRVLRQDDPGWLAFPSPRARTLRDKSNTAGDLRDALDRAGYEWVTFKTCRKTVATRMDEAGCSAREIADQLGHRHPSMTMDVYMGRLVVSAKAAQVLDR